MFVDKVFTNPFVISGSMDQNNGLGGCDEGVLSRMAAGYFTRRTETCRQVLNMLQEIGLVMMCAPLGSGKTSLCQLVAIMAGASSMFQQVYYFTCAAVNDDKSFQTQFCSMCGVTFTEAALQSSASNRTVIIIDEAQDTYDAATYLWSWVKGILSMPTNPQQLMIFTASSHGSMPFPNLGYATSAIEFSASHSFLPR